MLLSELFPDLSSLWDYQAVGFDLSYTPKIYLWETGKGKSFLLLLESLVSVYYGKSCCFISSNLLEFGRILLGVKTLIGRSEVFSKLLIKERGGDPTLFSFFGGGKLYLSTSLKSIWRGNYVDCLYIDDAEERVDDLLLQAIDGHYEKVVIGAKDITDSIQYIISKFPNNVYSPVFEKKDRKEETFHRLGYRQFEREINKNSLVLTKIR